MDMQELNYYYNRFRYGEDNYHELMQFRVREILLISTFYDAYIFQEDGRLSEEIFGEYYKLNLSWAPRVTSVPSGEDALKEVEKGHFDLVITTMRIGKLSPFDLSRNIKEKRPDLPVLLLMNVQSDLSIVERNKDKIAWLDDIYFWNGDSKIFLAMVKYIEDLKNVAYDTQKGLISLILLVEDSIKFYSILLPLLFTEVMKQTQYLLSDELTDMQKNYRMRARPKVLMAHTYNDALSICRRYKDYLIAVISDVSFPRDEQCDEQAGITLIRHLKSENFDIAYLLQSSDLRHSQVAKELKVEFVHKNSKTLLNELSQFININLGYGDFIFRDSKGKPVERARSLAEFESKLAAVPVESLLYHSRRNDYSAWLIAHGEVQVARAIRPVKDSDFLTPEDHRRFLINIFKEVWALKNRGQIVNFESGNWRDGKQIVRLADGSLGGKGRGIAFLNALLTTMEFEKRFPQVHIQIPRTTIIGTSEYDYFINTNQLLSAMACDDDQEIKQRFLSGALSPVLLDKLRIFLSYFRNPLAVRSSGLLEDSQSQPFAGVFQTYMISNNEADDNERLRQLCNAIKLVFASVFLRNARYYIEHIHFRVEEEKMAVIIQEIAGRRYDTHFYPHISGVAQSYNYYPQAYMKHADGVVSMALGLGQAVVEGERTFRFCPKYPELQGLAPEQLLKHSQTHFYAIDMLTDKSLLEEGEHARLVRLTLRTAEKEGSLWHLASVWDNDNHRLVDDLSLIGPRVVTFANVLRYNFFPLADILNELLDIGEKALGVPVEIEFAVDLTRDIKQNIWPSFYVLQIRPLTVNLEETTIELNQIDPSELLLVTEKGMGHGILDHLTDLIYVDPKLFNNNQTLEMLAEIAELNQSLEKEGRSYILVGPGRWGSRDRFLGIPVQWMHISQARIIVEVGIEGFEVDASQGAHFFHNLVAMNVGYFTVPYRSATDKMDWDWLHCQQIFHKKNHLLHLRFDKSLLVKMDGRSGLCVIYKPGYAT